GKHNGPTIPHTDLHHRRRTLWHFDCCAPSIDWHGFSHIRSFDVSLARTDANCDVLEIGRLRLEPFGPKRRPHASQLLRRAPNAIWRMGEARITRAVYPIRFVLPAPPCTEHRRLAGHCRPQVPRHV